MGEYITVKYFAESAFAKELYQATEDAAGYDLFTAKQKLFFLIQLIYYYIRFKMGNSNWFLWKSFSTFWYFERTFSYC